MSPSHTHAIRQVTKLSVRSVSVVSKKIMIKTVLSDSDVGLGRSINNKKGFYIISDRVYPPTAYSDRFLQ